MPSAWIAAAPCLSSGGVCCAKSSASPTLPSEQQNDPPARKHRSHPSRIVATRSGATDLAGRSGKSCGDTLHGQSLSGTIGFDQFVRAFRELHSCRDDGVLCTWIWPDANNLCFGIGHSAWKLGKAYNQDDSGCSQRHRTEGRRVMMTCRSVALVLDISECCWVCHWGIAGTCQHKATSELHCQDERAATFSAIRLASRTLPHMLPASHSYPSCFCPDHTQWEQPDAATRRLVVSPCGREMLLLWKAVLRKM